MGSRKEMKNLKGEGGGRGRKEVGAAGAAVPDTSSRLLFSTSPSSSSSSIGFSSSVSEGSLSSSVTSISSGDGSSCSFRGEEYCSDDDATSTGSGWHGGGPENDTLLLMGCVGCFMYVMVPHTNQRCPRCRTHALMRLFQ